MHMAQAICVTAQDLGTALSLQSPCFYICFSASSSAFPFQHLSTIALSYPYQKDGRRKPLPCEREASKGSRGTAPLILDLGTR
jgi:hypothetical protein